MAGIVELPLGMNKGRLLKVISLNGSVVSKKLLRDAQTREWLTHDNRFTPAIDAAAEIVDLAQIQRITRQHRDRKLQMVLYYPATGEEVILGLDD